ncbi:MAG: PepSY domain-containing protein, partial [Gammaproteobacteria bacterium]|nr:PepSY domain-containing protein [Gammaproteobacteria bacterium]MBU1556497.1 PepSY domain-containing protein [Gammaproteobacteria bacterium]
GVISLPYSFIFALTGLMFNLGLISQLVTLTLVYDGDRQRLLADAGFARVVAQPSGQVQQMPDLDQLIADWEQQQNADAHSVRLNHYGDKNALIRLIGQHNDNFAQRIDMTYRVRDGQFPPEINPAQRNAFADGTRFLYALHFGHFAGVDLRIIYSLLGLGVCAIIVAGNMLWLNKYSKKRDISPRVCRLLQATTLGGCIGIVLATGVGFLLERTLAPAWLGRTPVIETAFAITLLLSMLAAWCSHRAKHFVRQGMLVCALLLLLTVAGDVLMFGPQLLQLAQTGSAEVLAVSCSFALLAMLLLWLASRFRLTASQQPEYQYQQ